MYGFIKLQQYSSDGRLLQTTFNANNIAYYCVNERVAHGTLIQMMADQTLVRVQETPEEVEQLILKSWIPLDTYRPDVNH